MNERFFKLMRYTAYFVTKCAEHTAYPKLLIFRGINSM